TALLPSPVPSTSSVRPWNCSTSPPPNPARNGTSTSGAAARCSNGETVVRGSGRGCSGGGVSPALDSPPRLKNPNSVQRASPSQASPTPARSCKAAEEQIAGGHLRPQ